MSGRNDSVLAEDSIGECKEQWSKESIVQAIAQHPTTQRNMITLLSDEKDSCRDVEDPLQPSVTIFQMNTLSDISSGSSPTLGGFEGLESPKDVLDFTQRKWRYAISSPYRFVCVCFHGLILYNDDSFCSVLHRSLFEILLGFCLSHNLQHECGITLHQQKIYLR